jgi:serine/threonine protein kinase/cell division protein ZapA (FtsZ GTPase activity inhibitor)
MSDETLREDDTWQGPRSEGPGSRIGPFTLLRLIGEGGFGDVYEAEQEVPVKRRVALKIIKLGMDTREVIARFDAERQALAMMEHPHIARVLDAGATDSGRPYFVMELVDGEPIARYCDQSRLSIEERLRLFEQVCEAVQHAHTKGVIHRDLKPNNVLVSTHDGKPFAKVIDFGIAKATSGHLTDKTLATELNQVMGTPLYMSPEQASGSADIDTRTDIYSLGVILYELLTGSTPVDSATLRSAVFAEIQRIICDVEPPRPSVRLAQATTTLSETATHRGTDSRKLTRAVRGELDWIVMKALEKERGRRYATANGLAMDLRRYLAAEPVLAAPPSASYRLQKFARRNKVVVTAGLLIAASLLIGIIGFAWQARIAQARADELKQVSDFQAAMLGQVDPTKAGRLLIDDMRAKFAAALTKTNVPEGERAAQIAAFAVQLQRVNATDAATNLIDRTILKPAVVAIDKQFKNQPVVDATLRQSITVIYYSMGLYDAAMPLQRRVLATRRRVLGEEHRDTLESINDMGELLQVQGKLTEAEPYFREALAKRRRVLGDDDRDTLHSIRNMGMLLDAQSKLSEAEPYLREALQRSRRVLGEEDTETLLSISAMGDLLQDRGKLGEAEPYFREVLAKRRRVLGEEDSNTLTAIGSLGGLLQAEGKLSEAEPFIREALEKSRRVLGEEHPDTLTTISNLGKLLQDEGKLGEAEPYLREALEKSRRVLGEEHPDTLISVSLLGELLQDRGKPSEAEPYLREALEKRRRVLGEESPDTLISINYMGSLLVAEGKYAEAEKLLVPVEPAARKAFTGDALRWLASFLMHLGSTRAKLSEFAKAEVNLLEADSIFVRTLGPTHNKDVHECTQAIVDLYAVWNNAEPGKGYDAKAAEWKKKMDALSMSVPATATH